MPSYKATPCPVLPVLFSYCRGVILWLQEHLGNRRFVGLSPCLPRNFMLSFLFLWSHSQETDHRCLSFLDLTNLTRDWLLPRIGLGDGAAGSLGIYSESFRCLPSYLTLLASRKSFFILPFLGYRVITHELSFSISPHHEHPSFLTLFKILKGKANWGQEKGILNKVFAKYFKTLSCHTFIDHWWARHYAVCKYFIPFSPLIKQALLAIKIGL